jgi:general secretion pathway protein D/MSHA biogenesis protein MshL
MKSYIRPLSGFLAIAITGLLLCSCVGKKSEKQEKRKPARLTTRQERQRTIIEPALLPKRFQRAGYMINDDAANAMLDSNSSDEFQLKVGADISSREPITLREAMKALIRNKDMSLSWASDVNQDLVVDIDVTADDNFYEAIKNILRQLDYYHEVEGSTLIIKYRQTKQYQIAMPFVNQEYNASIGGNSFGSDVRIESKGNTFDIWENIRTNIDILIATWSSTITIPEAPEESDEEGEENDESETAPAQLSRRVSSTDSSYTIDKPIGLITVHAPQSLQKRIADYLDTLERELYKQILIEAKIIEVQLKDSSSLGINWNTLIKNLSVLGGSLLATKNYGKSSEVRHESSVTSSDSYSNTNTDSFKGTITDTYDSNSEDGNGSVFKGISGNDFKHTIGTESLTGAAKTVATLVTGGATNTAITGIGLIGFTFDSFINALKEQGETSVLSNPKISVMNGQPALISVGREVTFINSIESTTDDNNKTTFTVNTEQLLSGVGLALSAVIKRDNEIVMNLVPITSELLEPIEYVTVGENGKVGLPIVNKREMSTTVKIKDGSILVVGGLISESESTEGDFFFGMENIPYLKYLFGYEEKKKIKRELIILLRPRII